MFSTQSLMYFTFKPAITVFCHLGAAEKTCQHNSDILSPLKMIQWTR